MVLLAATVRWRGCPDRAAPCPAHLMSSPHKPSQGNVYMHTPHRGRWCKLYYKIVGVARCAQQYDRVFPLAGEYWPGSLSWCESSADKKGAGASSRGVVKAAYTLLTKPPFPQRG